MAGTASSHRKGWRCSSPGPSRLPTCGRPPLGRRCRSRPGLGCPLRRPEAAHSRLLLNAREPRLASRGELALIWGHSTVPEFDDIAVRHDIVLSFQAHLAHSTSVGDGPRGDKIIEGYDFSLDKALLEVTVNHARGLGGSGALGDGPGPGFLRP